MSDVTQILSAIEQGDSKASHVQWKELSMAKHHTLQVTYMDGKTEKFKLPIIEGTQTHLSEVIKRARLAPNLLIEADGKLVLIPMANVRMMELSPAPEGPPIPGLLAGAKRIT